MEADGRRRRHKREARGNICAFRDFCVTLET